MKNTIKILSIIAFIVIICFSMVACGSGDNGDNENNNGNENNNNSNNGNNNNNGNSNGNGNENGNGSGDNDNTISGNTITSGADVIYLVSDEDLTEAKEATDFGFYYFYEDNEGRGEIKSLDFFIDGSPSVAVSNNKVTINLGTLKSGSLEDITQLLGDNITVNPVSVKCFFIEAFISSDEKFCLFFMKDSKNIGYLIYVDEEVTINGTDTSLDGGKEWENIFNNVSLKKGWNYLLMSSETTNINKITNTFTSSTTLPDGYNWSVDTTDNYWGGSENGNGNDGGEDLTGTFTSIGALGTYLSGQPDNTTAAPYIVKLNVSGLGGSSDTDGSLGYVLIANNTKYIDLDLSDSTITGIEENAFYNCDSLTGVTLPANAGFTSIEGDAFEYCRNLTNVNIPNSVTSIGDAAFNWCISLTSVTIGNGVINIGGHAFYNCTSLTGVTLPNSVTDIGNAAFSSCTNLISVTFEGTISSVNFNNNVFQGDLRAKFYEINTTNGTPGTYTTTAPVNNNSKWAIQP